MRSFVGPPFPVTPFADWDHHHIDRPLRWQAEGEGAARLPAAEVPAGFVTDLASIPRVVWTVLPPQGRYAYPAIVHDDLYWFQPCGRDTADHVLRIVMRDLGVSTLDATVIYEAVRVAGGGPGRPMPPPGPPAKGACCRASRPTSPTTWATWKRDPANFV